MSNSFATLWTIACQVPLSIGFPREECWSRLPFPPPGDLPDPGIEPASPALQAESLPAEPLGKPSFYPCMFKSFHPPLGNSGLKKEERKNMKLQVLVSMEDWFTCYKAAMRKFFRRKINAMEL